MGWSQGVCLNVACRVYKLHAVYVCKVVCRVV